MLQNIPEKLYHKAPPHVRNYIKEQGLVPYVGDSYAMHWEDKVDISKLRPYVFLYDKNVSEYDSTWDDDIWEVETKLLNKNLLMPDPDIGMYENLGCYVYPVVIEPNKIKLVYKGTGKSY